MFLQVTRGHEPIIPTEKMQRALTNLLRRSDTAKARGGVLDLRMAAERIGADIPTLKASIHEFGDCCRANPADFRRSLPLIRRIASASVDSECGPLRATSSRHASFVLVQVLILLLHLQQVDENQLGMETITSANLPKAGVDYNLQHDTRVHFDDL